MITFVWRLFVTKMDQVIVLKFPRNLDKGLFSLSSTRNASLVNKLRFSSDKSSAILFYRVNAYRAIYKDPIEKKSW